MRRAGFLLCMCSYMRACACVHVLVRVTETCLDVIGGGGCMSFEEEDACARACD